MTARLPVTRFDFRSDEKKQEDAKQEAKKREKRLGFEIGEEVIVMTISSMGVLSEAGMDGVITDIVKGRPMIMTTDGTIRVGGEVTWIKKSEWEQTAQLQRDRLMNRFADGT